MSSLHGLTIECPHLALYWKMFFEISHPNLQVLLENAYYQKMSPLFYMLNGVSEPNLKQVYTNSLPNELQNELHRVIVVAKKDLSTITIGQIH